MEISRKLVIFPIDQFYAIVGNLTLPEDPYAVSLTDILNDRSAMTHRQGNHEHRSGRIFLDDAECFDLHDNTRRICAKMTEVYIPVHQIRAAIDVHPEHYRGNADKRRESEERRRRHRDLLFPLHGHTVRGVADVLEVYRKSDHFVGLTEVAIDDEPVTSAGVSLSKFLHHLSCPPPDFIAVNLKCVIHS
jgi:hypothetical protein